MITVNDIILKRSQAQNGITEAAIIGDLIKEDKSSVAKKEMNEGVLYYDTENSFILNFDFRKFFVDAASYIDYAASNNKIVNAFHTVLTDQKNGYICGNPIVLTSDEKNEKQLKNIKLVLGKYFDDTMCSWELQSTNKGVEALHPYIDNNGVFRYVIIPAQQIIWIYDSLFQTELKEVIRYYEVEYVNSNFDIETRLKAEWWTEKDVTFFIEDSKGEFKLEQVEGLNNPRGHFSVENSAIGKRTASSWGKVPFIPLPNNNRFRSDLYLIKTLIDDFDFNSSDFSNILRDHQENIWNIKGSNSTDISELRRQLRVMRMALTDINGGLESLTNPIEKDARDSHLDRLEDNIYIFGQGVNPKKASGGGNITNVFIKSLFSLLDIKANRKIRKFEKAIRELIWFVNEFNDEQHNEHEFDAIFNKSIIINEFEQTQIAIMSRGVASDETVLANLPIVDDVADELEKIANQEVNIFDDQNQDEPQNE